MENLLEQFINELVRNIRAVENNTTTHISVTEFCTLLIRSLTVYKPRFNWWQRMVVDVLLKQLLAFVVKAEKAKIESVVSSTVTRGLPDVNGNIISPTIQRSTALEDDLEDKLERLDTLKSGSDNDLDFIKRLDLDRLALEELQRSVAPVTVPTELTPFEKQLQRNEEILKERIAARNATIPTL